MSEALTYAKVGGPPEDWTRLEVVDLASGNTVPAVEVNTVEEWAIVYEEPSRIDKATGRLATQRIEGRFEIRRRVPA